MPGHDENLGIGIALTIGSGFATVLGASVVYLPSLVRLANPLILAGSMAVSAGVMIFVSFMEIMVKSRRHFIDAGYNETNAAFYAACCFFAGIFFMTAVNSAAHKLGSSGNSHHDPTESRRNFQNKNIPANDDSDSSSVRSFEIACPCSSDDPLRDLENVQSMANQMQASDAVAGGGATAHHDMKEALNPADEEEAASQLSSLAKKKLTTITLSTALAVGLHNFPEGLATYVAALDDPSVGVVLAIAVAIHNIPEGLCVAMPIYFATQNRRKAILWATLAGISEPVGALAGYLILANSVSDIVYGFIFGLVAGMMVIVSIRELLPTARRYDPKDTTVTNSFVIGMGLMAMSLLMLGPST